MIGMLLIMQVFKVQYVRILTEDIQNFDSITSTYYVAVHV